MKSQHRLTSERLADVAALRAAEKYQEAISICDHIILEETDCWAAFRARSRIFRELGRYEDAIFDITRVIKMRPDLLGEFIERAIWYLEIGNDEIALDDIDFVISKGEKYFEDAAYFYKAVANFGLSKKQQMLDACHKLPENFKFYVKTFLHGGRVLTKSDLIRFAATLRD